MWVMMLCAKPLPLLGLSSPYIVTGLPTMSWRNALHLVMSKPFTTPCHQRALVAQPWLQRPISHASRFLSSTPPPPSKGKKHVQFGCYTSILLLLESRGEVSLICNKQCYDIVVKYH